ncbi:MAG: YmdB family metallophosphoesterase [Alphaproteobacteria bacterium]|nr:YmdB family metallophosphoesterase [Alphaproteobacteria bacterium]
MKLLFCGDVVGRSGREAVLKHLPGLVKEHALDFVVVSVDNAAGGFGVSPEVAREFLNAGVDVLTGGDHIWDQKEIVPYLAQEKRLLRPANFPAAAPGAGHGVFPARDGRKVLVLHLLGQVFHKEHAACPFATADAVLESVRLGGAAQAILVDMHAEATSEKNAMGLYLDGRVSLVVGSHTHVPTADARLLPKGTAYLTDAGMCGDYNSIIGFAPEGPLTRFLTKIPKARMEPASGEGTLCGVVVETDDATGLARSIRTVRAGAA